MKNIPEKTICFVTIDKTSILKALVSNIPSSKSNKNTIDSTIANRKKVFIVL